MASCTFGIVGHIDPDKINEIIQLLEQKNIDIVAIKQSWGRLWIKEDRP